MARFPLPKMTIFSCGMARRMYSHLLKFIKNENGLSNLRIWGNLEREKWAEIWTMKARGVAAENDGRNLGRE